MCIQIVSSSYIVPILENKNIERKFISGNYRPLDIWYVYMEKTPQTFFFVFFPDKYNEIFFAINVI